MSKNVSRETIMINLEKEQLAAELQGSLLEFTRFFYPLLTGRDFIMSYPIGMESHFISISRALTKAFRLELPTHRLIINVSPGAGKSLLCSMFVAWSMATYPDSKFIYVSYSKSLAVRHCSIIKRIMSLQQYAFLFGVSIRYDSKANEFFQTTAGGHVSAFGTQGAVVGVDAGMPHLDRFSGCVIIDDAHKIDEVHSDTIREGVIENYRETIQQRPRSPNVPIIFIGQRTHEADLAQYLLDGKDGYEWSKVILPAIDDAGNAFYPEVYPLDKLRTKQQTDPYVWASQFQQNPVASGTGLFKPEWFVILDEEPETVFSFITIDTAETNKNWNDATVFSFFGVYEITNFGVKTGEYGLHWLDCLEQRIEPRYLKESFISFYTSCIRHPCPPQLACIEKKSTGVTLISMLEDFRGIQIRGIERNRSGGNKTHRFLEIQPYIASKLITFTQDAKHANLCIDHMSKITANETHRFDDIADTLADGIKLALIDKTIISTKINKTDYNEIAKNLTSKQNKISKLHQNIR